MHTARLTLIAIVLALAAAPARAGPKQRQGNHGEEAGRTGRDSQEPQRHDVREGQGLPAAGRGGHERRHSRAGRPAARREAELSTPARPWRRFPTRRSTKPSAKPPRNSTAGNWSASSTRSGNAGTPRRLNSWRSCLTDKDEAVASAAAGALGRIGTPEAATRWLHAALPRRRTVQIAAADACLACAERLAAGTDERGCRAALRGCASGRQALQRRIRADQCPSTSKSAALRGLFRLHGAAERRTLLLEADSVRRTRTSSTSAWPWPAKCRARK